MRVRVTCAGVLIGAADFQPGEGVAHAPLTPSAGYQLATAAARALGEQFARTQFWSPAVADFADEAAARWTGERLALEDEVGREQGVANVVVLERPLVGARSITVVADFRPDAARVEAFLRTVNPGGGRSRPPA